MNDGPGDDDRGVVRSWLSSITHRRGIDSRRRGAARATLHPISSALTPLPDGSGAPWDWAGRGGAGVDARVAPHHLSPDQQRNTVQAAVAGMADDGIGPAFGESSDMAPHSPGSSAQPTDHDHRAHETERVHALYTDMTCGLVVLNRRGELVDANDAAQRILGVRLDEMRGQPSSVALWRAIGADGADPHEGEKLIGTALRTRRPMRATMVHATRPDGRLRWLQVDAVPVREDGNGSPGDGQGPVIVSFIDITAHREVTEILRARAECATLQNTAATVLSTSAALRDAVPHLLQAICDGAGWEVGRFWSVDHRDNVLRCDALWRRPSSVGAGFAALGLGATCAPDSGVPGRVWTSGAPAWVAGMGAPTPGSGAPLTTIGGLYGTIGIPVPIAGAVQGVMEFVGRDIRPPHADLVAALVAIGAQIGQFMERKRAEEALRRQALHDVLTGLPNRALLHDRLEQALRVAGRDNTPLALLLIDLDGFKTINDTLGHHQGDLLLREVGTRLRAVLRQRDTVARLGGDEFVALLPGDDGGGATRTARKVLAALAAPIMAEGRRFVVGASIGVALYPAHGTDAAALLRCADAAMYAAKRAAVRPGGNLAVYAAPDRDGSDRQALGDVLRHAIAHDGLLLHYQPTVDIATGDVRRVEALVRCRRPEQGLLPDEHFIPRAEQADLGAALTRWTLDAALRQCRRWEWAGLPLGIAVNLSRFTLRDPRLPDTIIGLLAQHAVRPSRLQVEVRGDAIAEGMATGDTARALAALTRLRTLGVRISADASDGGRASLASLARLPLDEFKIDAAAVRRATENSGGLAIVSSAIDAGHGLGLRVVARGVEDADTWDLLTDLGCDEAQGDYLSPPLPAGELIRRLGVPQGVMA
jgi:diguanylate cyclase (GGDEF)-like protein/PAS domain S-box-containing protein